MQHFIPSIRRSEKQAERVAFKNQLADAGETINGLREASDSLVDYELIAELENSSGVYLTKKDREIVCGVITNKTKTLFIFPSLKFSGHVFANDSKQNGGRAEYLGACEEVHFVLQDAICTEMRYAQRTREKIIKGKNGLAYSDYQKQIAMDFLCASEMAGNLWLDVLDKFEVTCRELEIGLSVGGYQPQDIVPKSLHYK